MMHAQRTRMEPDRAEISARIAVYPPGADPEITEIAAAEERKAGEIVVDEGDGHERIVQFLEQQKVI